MQMPMSLLPLMHLVPTPIIIPNQTEKKRVAVPCCEATKARYAESERAVSSVRCVAEEMRGKNRRNRGVLQSRVSFRP